MYNDERHTILSTINNIDCSVVDVDETVFVLKLFSWCANLIHWFLMRLLNISQLLKDLMNLCFILNTTLGSKSTSLSAGIHMRVLAVQYDLRCFGSFFLVSACWSCHYLSWRWVPSLPLLVLHSVYYGQGSTIWLLEGGSHFWILCFSWLTVWADGINKWGWCLAGGRGCWLKGLHQISSARWLFHHCLNSHIY